MPPLQLRRGHHRLSIKLLAIYLFNNRVIHNVLTDLLEGCFISYDMLIIIALPYGMPQSPGPCHPRFKHLNDLAERFLRRLKNPNDVQVIRHHHALIDRDTRKKSRNLLQVLLNQGFGCGGCKPWGSVLRTKGYEIVSVFTVVIVTQSKGLAVWRSGTFSHVLFFLSSEPDIVSLSRYLRRRDI